MKHTCKVDMYESVISLDFPLMNGTLDGFKNWGNFSYIGAEGDWTDSLLLCAACLLATAFLWQV